MKKLKYLFYIILIFILAGCKTSPIGTTVNSLDLLDDKSAFYLSVPTHVDEVLVKEVLKRYMPDVSDKDLDKICSRIYKVYLGINNSKFKTEIQASADTNIPISFLPRILSKKNGWTTREPVVSNLQGEYKIFNLDNLDLCFPSSNLAFFGREIDEMVSKYDEIFFSSQVENPYNSPLDDEIYTFLNNNSDEIRFYAIKPQSFLNNLTGTSLNLKLINVQGSFKPDNNSDLHYLLNLNFNFKSEKYLKAGRALLMLAFGLTNSQVYVQDTHLVLENIQISREQIYNIIKI